MVASRELHTAREEQITNGMVISSLYFLFGTGAGHFF